MLKSNGTFPLCACTFTQKQEVDFCLVQANLMLSKFKQLERYAELGPKLECGCGWVCVCGGGGGRRWLSTCSAVSLHSPRYGTHICVVVKSVRSACIVMLRAYKTLMCTLWHLKTTCRMLQDWRNALKFRACCETHVEYQTKQNKKNSDKGKANGRYEWI